jgi:prepilin-type N-terminal cleavage/methylation domain-containing protein
MNQKGFTLLEVILALSILATIGIITVNILSGQIATRQKIADLNTDKHSLDAALHRITKDLQGAYISDKKNITSLNLYKRPVSPQFYVKKENFVFSTMAFQSYLCGSNQSNQAFVRYTTATDPNDSNKKQLLRVVDTDLVENIEKDDVGLSQVLLDDIEKFTVEFWDGNQFRTEWDSSANDTQDKLPKLVRVHLSIYSSEKTAQQQASTPAPKRTVYSVDTIVYIYNAQGLKEVTPPTWSEYKWQ